MFLVEVGDVMCGGMFGVVEVLNSDVVQVGDIVFGGMGWEDYFVVFGEMFNVLLMDIGIFFIGFLSGIGMMGFIVYFGFLDIGQFKEGEILVVLVVVGVVGLIVG